jgi:hypothetical protein
MPVGPTTVISGRVTGIGIPDLQTAGCEDMYMQRVYRAVAS